MTTVDQAHLERETEIGTLAAALDAADASAGGLVLIEAPAGMGKTALLSTVRSLARDRGGMRTYARATELETAYGFGVVRQLLEPALRALSPEEQQVVLSSAAAPAAQVLGLGGPAAPPPEPGFATLHALHWLAVGLAERAAPLVLCVDDAQWADAASLRWLTFVATRASELPILLVAALRSGEPTPHSGLVGHLRAAATTVVRPEPLSYEGVHALLEAELGSDTADAIARSCHEAVAGNPFYLRQLVIELRDRTAPLSEEGERLIRRLGPRAIARVINVRVSLLGREAAALARAGAVAGDHGSASLVVRLAGLTEAAADAAARALLEADILDSHLTYVHPIVRQALDADLGPAERQRLHARAAELLAESGAAPEQIAGHLLRTEPSRDPATVATMRAAAGAALARGAPDHAAAYLRRALADADDGTRGEVLVELGLAEALAFEPAAMAHLAEGVPQAPPPLAFAARRTLGVFLCAGGQPEAAVGVLRKGVVALTEHDPGLADALEADLSGAAALADGPAPERRAMLARHAETADAATPHGRMALVAAAFESAKLGTAAETTAELVRRADAGGALLAEQPPIGFGVLAFFFAHAAVGTVAEAESALAARLEDHRTAGAVGGVAFLSCLLSHLCLRRGALAEAEAHARLAIDLTPPQVPLSHVANHAFLLEALVERGELAAAEDTLRDARLDGELPTFGTSGLLRERRGALRVALGRVEEGLEDLLETGRRHARWGLEGPGLSQWRSHAALAHAALGRDDDARALAAQDVELARAYGAARPLGIALRAAALTGPRDWVVPGLQAAVAELDTPDAVLDRARALVDLGAALRRANQRSAAREPLQDALDLAHRSGATALVAQARDELLATGARPRRLVRRGRDALTASELRVARMAADGSTNREIAQRLYVSLKTVELHLTNAYRKLGVAGRAELRDALDGNGP